MSFSGWAGATEMQLRSTKVALKPCIGVRFIKAIRLDSRQALANFCPTLAARSHLGPMPTDSPAHELSETIDWFESGIADWKVLVTPKHVDGTRFQKYKPGLQGVKNTLLALSGTAG